MDTDCSPQHELDRAGTSTSERPSHPQPHRDADLNLGCRSQERTALCQITQIDMRAASVGRLSSMFSSHIAQASRRRMSTVGDIVLGWTGSIQTEKSSQTDENTHTHWSQTHPTTADSHSSLQPMHSHARQLLKIKRRSRGGCGQHSQALAAGNSLCVRSGNFNGIGPHPFQES